MSRQSDDRSEGTAWGDNAPPNILVRVCAHACAYVRKGKWFETRINKGGGRGLPLKSRCGITVPHLFRGEINAQPTPRA